MRVTPVDSEECQVAQVALMAALAWPKRRHSSQLQLKQSGVNVVTKSGPAKELQNHAEI